MPRTPHIFVFPPLKSSQVPTEPYGEGTEGWKTLSRIIAINVAQSSLGQAGVVLRLDPKPRLAVAGRFSEAEAEHIRTAIPWFASALSRLRYVDYAQVEADCVRLGEHLREHLSGETLGDVSFVGIPRGGTVVLGLLSYVLDLDHSQVNPSEPTAGPLVVVDDCFLSGARLARFLDEHPSPSKIVAAGLYAHPDLRAAVERDRPRIQACVTARDLTDHAPSIYGDDYEAWKTRWENRETGPQYWTGISEHLCFPWSEPDYGVWNEETGQTEQAWTVVPPDHCLKTRFGASTDAEAPVQVQRSASGAISVPSTVFYATFDDRVLIGGGKSDECLELTGTAAAMWHALIEHGTVEDILDALLDTYSVDRAALRADLIGFVGQLASNDLLHVPDGALA